MINNEDIKISKEEFENIKSNKELLQLIEKKGKNIDDILFTLNYEDELKKVNDSDIKKLSGTSDDILRNYLILERSFFLTEVGITEP